MKRIYDKAEKKCCPPNIKFRLISPETFDETFALMATHFLPREPISICLKALDRYDQNTTNEEIGHDGEWLYNVMKSCSTTIIAQDSLKDDKVIGAVCAGIAKKMNKDGTTVDWYNTEDISNEELLKKWSEMNLELKGIKFHIIG